jgi:TonB family protein
MSRAVANANDSLPPFSQIGTIRLVVDFNSPLARFFAASVVLHIFAFVLFAWPRIIFPSVPQESIKVSLLPEPPVAEPPPRMETPAPSPKPAPPAAQQPAPRRASKAPSIVAKKNSATAAAPRYAENVKRNPESPPQESRIPETSRENPPAREPVRENTVIVERALPTLKDLLPPVTYSAHENSEESSVSLNTTDPKYMTYVGKIKQSIETVWQYPEIALRYGLQGRLSLEFTVSGNGELETLRLVRSSGSTLLDEEALRAIKAAAPFPPIPPWIKSNPLRISATMEYRDSRLDYRFTR